jgi:hypothetical protein
METSLQWLQGKKTIEKAVGERTVGEEIGHHEIHIDDLEKSGVHNFMSKKLTLQEAQMAVAVAIADRRSKIEELSGFPKNMPYLTAMSKLDSRLD